MKFNYQIVSITGNDSKYDGELSKTFATLEEARKAFDSINLREEMRVEWNNTWWGKRDEFRKNNTYFAYSLEEVTTDDDGNIETEEIDYKSMTFNEFEEKYEGGSN